MNTEKRGNPAGNYFIMDIASMALIKPLVDNIVTPMITPFVPGGIWRTATVELGPIVISWGKSAHWRN